MFIVGIVVFFSELFLEPDLNFRSHLVFSELKNGEVFNEVDVLKLVHRVDLFYQGASQV